ncbi:MAG: chorismate-binding protein [bacterium]|nr:chorismate-binding protein [bacterium]
MEETHAEKNVRLRELARYATADSATLLLRVRDEEHAWCAGGIRHSGSSIADLLADRDGGSIIPVCFRIDYDCALKFFWQPSWLVELREDRLCYYGEVPLGEVSEDHEFEPVESEPLEADAYPAQRWNKAVAKIQAHIQQQQIRKAVLSRQLSLFSSEPWPVDSVLVKLLQHSTGTSVYAHQLSDKKVWLGASPEVLFHREGRKIFVDSLAGTKKTIRLLKDRSENNPLSRTSCAPRLNRCACMCRFRL